MSKVGAHGFSGYPLWCLLVLLYEGGGACVSEITGTSSQKLRHLPRKRRRGFRSCVLSFFPFSLMALSSSPQILHVAPQADIVDHDAVRRELEANGTPLP